MQLMSITCDVIRIKMVPRGLPYHRSMGAKTQETKLNKHKNLYIPQENSLYTVTHWQLMLFTAKKFNVG